MRERNQFSQLSIARNLSMPDCGTRDEITTQYLLAALCPGTVAGGDGRPGRTRSDAVASRSQLPRAQGTGHPGNRAAHPEKPRWTGSPSGTGSRSTSGSCPSASGSARAVHRRNARPAHCSQCAARWSQPHAMIPRGARFRSCPTRSVTAEGSSRTGPRRQWSPAAW